MLEDNVADAEITVDQLAAYVGMGRTSMYNKIKRPYRQVACGAYTGFQT